jgi:hypothetical protein
MLAYRCPHVTIPSIAALARKSGTPAGYRRGAEQGQHRRLPYSGFRARCGQPCGIDVDVARRACHVAAAVPIDPGDAVR